MWERYITAELTACYWVSGLWVKWVNKPGWVTWVTGQYLRPIHLWPVNQWLSQSHFKNYTIFNNFRPIDRFSRFCAAHGRACLYFIMCRPGFFPKLLFPMWIYTPILIHGSTDPLESITRTASRSVQPFNRAHYCSKPTDQQTTLLGL